MCGRFRPHIFNIGIPILKANKENHYDNVARKPTTSVVG